jgi:hypothetical protein
MSEAANQAVWSAVVADLVFVPTNAIPQLWLQLRANGTYLGPPLTDELARADGGVEQAFTSGAVIAWAPGNDAWLDN